MEDRSVFDTMQFGMGMLLVMGSPLYVLGLVSAAWAIWKKHRRWGAALIVANLLPLSFVVFMNVCRAVFDYHGGPAGGSAQPFFEGVCEIVLWAPPITNGAALVAAIVMLLRRMNRGAAHAHS